MNPIRTVRYIEATPGDLIADVAEEARNRGVPCILHNGTLYRATDFARVADVEPTSLRRTAARLATKTVQAHRFQEEPECSRLQEGDE